MFAKFASLVNVCLRKPVNKPPVYEIVYERRLNKLVYENCHEVYKHSQTRSEFANVCETFAKTYEIHESLQTFRKHFANISQTFRKLGVYVRLPKLASKLFMFTCVYESS